MVYFYMHSLKYNHNIRTFAFMLEIENYSIISITIPNKIE